jgi:hypothetical protein
MFFLLSGGQVRIGIGAADHSNAFEQGKDR